jgi:alpha-mannosidase
MQTGDRHRLARHVRRLEELHLWRNAREAPVQRWTFSAGDGEQEISVGDFWPRVETPVHLSATATIPEDWDGEAVELELWLGGEGFVRLSNGTSGGLNPFHRAYGVTPGARGGERVGIEAEVVARGLFGSEIVEPRLGHAALVVPDGDVRALERDVRVVVEACAELGDHDVVAHLLDVLDAAIADLFHVWPSETETVLTRYLRGFENPFGNGLSGLPDAFAKRARQVDRDSRRLWHTPDSPGGILPLPDAAREAVRGARKLLAARLTELRTEFPPAGRLAMTGHAHIDLAWLWPLAETRRKARRTFASTLSLMDRYDDFVFNQSSAQLYRWLEEDDPEMFERVRRRVAAGRWEAVGGSWCEPDCQMTGGEAFARQLLYGQRYFEEKFGVRSSVAWLPDAFGFSPGIPQILRGAGIDSFFTHKMKWSETNLFPHDLFHWEGLDGSRVRAHFFRNPGSDYNGDVTPFDLLGTWRNFAGRRRHPESLFAFGWGDGGGGPSEDMLESYDRLRDFPALPRLRMSRVDDFFDGLPQEDLPVWAGELYLELHRGTLTTQGLVKKLNREGEHRLLEAEAFATIAALYGSEYPGEELKRLWEILLLNQFHDILPGSSIAEVYADAHEQLREVVAGAERLRDGALRALAGGVGATEAGSTVVANASLNPRSASELGDGYPDVSVPGLGWATLSHGAAEPAVEVGTLDGGGAYLQNQVLRVEVGADGTLHRVHDREARREVLADRANQVWAYADKPRDWDAWDVEWGYDAVGEEIPASAVETGRDAVRVERRWRDSKIVQTYGLRPGSRRLDVQTEVDWREREVFLRALFPLAVHAHEATFETMYGAQRRPTHRNTTWDATRFEVSAHRFVDLSEPGYGVALLNDGKYGHSAHGNVLGISLLRGPMYPDPRADEGEHHFTYSLLPHPGDWTRAGVAAEAFALNSPLVATEAKPGAGDLPPEYGFVEASGLPLALGALKISEDGRAVVVRLHEPHGARGECVLRFAERPRSVRRANLLEEPEAALEVGEGGVRVGVRPFEILTLRVEFG